MAEEVSLKKSKRLKKILLRTGLVIISVLLLLIIVIAIVLNTIVTPERITPIVLNLAKEYVNADVKCKNIDITFFSTFPDLGIKLENGSIISHTIGNDSVPALAPSAQDSLLVFDNFTVALNPVDFIFNHKVVIRKLDIENANIYAFVDKDGKANWDIFSASPSEEVAEDSTRFVTPELNINNIRLRNINLVYDDMREDMFVMIDSLHMRLNGNMSKEHADLNLGVFTKGISSYYQGQTFTENLRFGIRTDIKRDRVKKTIELDKAGITIGTLQFRANGTMDNSTDREVLNINIDYTLDASSINDLLAMIPKHISELPSKLTATGEIVSNGKISGSLGKGNLPVVTWNSQLKDGSLRAIKYPDKPIIEKFDLDFNSLLDISGAQPSTIKLNKLFLQTASSELSVKGSFDDLLNNTSINTNATAKINFTQIAQKLSFIEDTEMRGNIEFDLRTDFHLNDILLSNYGKINANGTANIKDITYHNKKDNLLFYASNANMRFGSNTQDSIRGTLRESLLRGSVSMDSLNLNWNEDIIANAGKVSARFNTSEAADTNSIAPISTSARVTNLKFSMGDSLRMGAKRTSASIRLLPQKDKPSLPEINVRLSLDTLLGRFFTVAGKINKANLNLKFDKQQPRTRRFSNRMAVRNDSVQRSDSVANDSIRRAPRRNSRLTQAQRDSLRNSMFNPETNLSFRIESEETRNLLRQWDVTGDGSCTYISLRTPVFPLPIRMHQSDFSFTANKLSVTKADMQFGSSDISLKGEIEGIRAALLYNGKVSAKLSVVADSLDFNQLIKAAVAGSEYMEKSTLEKDTISQIVLDESNESIVSEAVDSTALSVFVVPRNLDLEFNAFIKQGKFNDINIKNTRGRILIREQAVHLPRFMLNTDIGSAFTTLVYKAPDRKGAHLGLELKMNKIDIKELIGTFPMMDELTPMLRSFEGVVDCDMTAVTELDSVMNVKLPQTTASCYLHGKNLVLLDGETFSEISKMLMFKNKNRNVIDSVSVEMILEEEKLMIFPFKVSMDRYSAAVGGIQNLDFTFDYHITVLKSPLPFKLGLNISGNPDKMKIRLAKAKYKDLFTVARQEDLDNTVINLRVEMQKKLQQNIEEIVGADLSRPIRRTRTVIPDSLKNTFFKLDTTTVVIDSISTLQVTE